MIALLCALLVAVLGPDLDRAESAYRDGRFEDALASFALALAETDAPEGPVLYAMGNCAFRMSRYAEAVRHYRRALLRLPGDPRVTFNLALAEHRLGVEPPGRSPIGNLAAWTERLPRGTLVVAAALLEALGLAGLMLCRRSSGIRFGAALCLALGLAGAARFAQLEWRGPITQGVVLSRQIALHTEPHADVPVTCVLRAGELVRVAEGSDRWLRVTGERGDGWTERAGIGLVD